MENSKIGWTDNTWNPWWGCNKVSAACKYCYIGQIMKRSNRDHKPFKGPIRTGKQTWRKAFAWNRKAALENRRLRVFTCSMSDFFHAKADKWRDEAWDVIRECKHLDWLILTKRPHRIARCLPDNWDDGYPNVWLGTTVESQEYIDRIDDLSKVPAAIRFVSAEPLLGPLRFGRRIRHLDWVITGCEQAAKTKRRPMDLDWVRSVRSECDAARVPLYHKQYYQGTTLMYDGLLDGEIRQEHPTVRS